MGGGDSGVAMTPSSNTAARIVCNPSRSPCFFRDGPTNPSRTSHENRGSSYSGEAGGSRGRERQHRHPRGIREREAEERGGMRKRRSRTRGARALYEDITCCSGVQSRAGQGTAAGDPSRSLGYGQAQESSGGGNEAPVD